MLQHQQLELLTYERQKMFLEEAEQRRLEEMLLAQSRPKHKPIHHLLRWIGAHLVRWGLQLQGEQYAALYRQPAPPMPS
jgi:hypothetical protein